MDSLFPNRESLKREGNPILHNQMNGNWSLPEHFILVQYIWGVCPTLKNQVTFAVNGSVCRGFDNWVFCIEMTRALPDPLFIEINQQPTSSHSWKAYKENYISMCKGNILGLSLKKILDSTAYLKPPLKNNTSVTNNSWKQMHQIKKNIFAYII